MHTQSNMPGPEFTVKDVDRLIGSYGEKQPAHTRDLFAAKLEGERAAFEKCADRFGADRTGHEFER